MTIIPFRGIRYNLEKVGSIADVVAPPYDVISPSGQEALYEKSPHNIVRLDFGKQSSSDSASDNRYTRAARDFEAWLKEGVLLRDSEPSFYLYEQQFTLKGSGPYARRGFFALRRLEHFGEGQIQPHEKTLAGPKADRLELMRSCRANLSPIFSLYSDPKQELAESLKPHFEKQAWIDFKDNSGIRHRLWQVVDLELFELTNTKLEGNPLFIADGHHRYETAVAFRDEMLKQYPNASQDAPFQYVMMFFSDMSDPGLLILPTHRLLHHRHDFEFKRLISRLEEWFDVAKFDHGDDVVLRDEMSKFQSQGVQAIGLLPHGESAAYLLTLSKERRGKIPALKSVEAPVQEVDTLILHRVIFEELLGLSEEDQKDPQFVRFIKDWDEAVNARQESDANAVFLMNPTPMTTLQKVANAGLILPPKTTYFYPKLLTGLVINQLGV